MDDYQTITTSMRIEESLFKENKWMKAEDYIEKINEGMEKATAKLFHEFVEIGKSYVMTVQNEIRIIGGDDYGPYREINYIVIIKEIKNEEAEAIFSGRHRERRIAYP